MRVAGYGRVSTSEQAVNGTSPEEQKTVIENQCKKLGYKLFQFYSDDGFSGRNDNRPGLQKMLNDAKTGKFDLVMFTKLDRLGRNLRDVKNILHKIKELSLEFYCVEQTEVNKNGLYGTMILNILSTFSEFESGLIRQRTSSGRMARWRNNESLMGSIPYGYVKNENGKIVIHDGNRKVYDKIVSLYLDQNYCMRDIAIKLKEDAIPSPGNALTWYNTTVRDILRNPAYVGETYYNRYEFQARQSVTGKQYYTPTKKEKPQDQWIKVVYPPLISKEKFDKIQTLIESKKSKPKKHHVGSEEKFMAENVLFCGYCGAKIKKTKTPISNFHYCCFWWETSQKELKIQDRQRCVLRYIDADNVDEQIFNEVVKILSNPSKFAKSWFHDQSIEELKLKVERLQKRDAELKNKIKEGYQLITKALKPELKSMYLEMHAKDEVEYSENLKNLKNAEISLDFAQNKVARLKDLQTVITSERKALFKQHFDKTKLFTDFLYNLPFKEKKRLIEAVVSVEAGGKCLVRYPTQSDIVDDIRSVPKQERYEPLLDRDPLVECLFNLDLDKIESIISGLNKKDLLCSDSTRRAS